MKRISYYSVLELIQQMVDDGVLSYYDWDDVLDWLSTNTDRPFSHVVEYDEYMASDLWKEERERQLREHGFRCEICGSDQNVQVHHITYQRGRTPLPSDFAVLCRDCHEKVHRIIYDAMQEDYRTLREIYDGWRERNGKRFGEQLAMRMNAEWPDGIPGPRKMRSACIVRDTLMQQKNVDLVPPRHDVLMHNLIKKK